MRRLNCHSAQERRHGRTISRFTPMKIVFLPEFDKDRSPGADSDAAPEPDRVAGVAYVVEVPTTPTTSVDRLSDTEWSALMGLN